MNFNKGIKKVEIDGDRIYLKKSFLGWGVVHPLQIGGKWNWFNVITGGSWLKFAINIFIIIIMILAIFEVKGIVEVANQCLNSNPIPAWPN